MDTKNQASTIYLIDGSSFLYRSYYALKPLHAPDGTAVQAVYGFVRMINKLIKQFQPRYCALVWDSKGTTARHTIYPDYKATRQAAPSDLHTQKALIQEFAHLIQLHQVAQEGVEADDLMASLARDYAEQGYTVVIITSDKDMRQIVDEQIVVFDPFKNLVLDKATLEKKYGFSLKKLPFYFGLIGDSSDNIPGVKGIGPKGAEKLVQQFDSMAALYDQLNEAGSERTQMLLAQGKENAFLSEQLFTLRYYQTGVTLEQLQFNNPATIASARPLFERLNFTSLLKESGHGLSAQATATFSFAERYGYTFVTVTTEEILAQMCDEIRSAGACALDTETDGVAVRQSTLVGLSFCCKVGTAYYIPIAHTTGEPQLDRTVIFNYIAPLLEDTSLAKHLQNAKFDMHVLSNAGIELQGLAFDTMVAAGLLRHEGDRLGLKILSERYCNETMLTYKEVVSDQKLQNFTQVPLARATDYAAADAHQTFKLVELLQHALRAEQQEKLFYELEMPLVNVLYEMEKEGIRLSVKRLQELDEKVAHQLSILAETIAAHAGVIPGTVNLNSPQQVSDLLFVHLGIKPLKKTASKTGYSTDYEVLATLAHEHPIAGMIMEYRELFKLKSTYIDALPSAVNPSTGRLHTTFKQTSVATGRLASADPNLQNIPDMRGELSIRSAFKADHGQRFIAADYSQMELRVLAHLSHDTQLLNAFLTGEDIHTHTAIGLFGGAADAITHEQRQLAKRINFSILYGMTPFGLAKDLGISQSQAKEYIQNYMAHYPQVEAWIAQVIDETKQHGYVTTWYGRRRYLPEIHEKNHSLYQQACRVAVNTKVQGTAAEIMKLGMLQLQAAFGEQLPEAKILLQIHDELLITVPEASVERGTEIVAAVLQNVVAWEVPLVVSVRSGSDWGEVSK